jgi:hypothetical protein
VYRTCLGVHSHRHDYHQLSVIGVHANACDGSLHKHFQTVKSVPQVHRTCLGVHSHRHDYHQLSVIGVHANASDESLHKNFQTVKIPQVYCTC